MSLDEEEKIVWTPDIVGPIYKKHSISFREVLNAHRDDRCTRIMATFAPDELIYEVDLSRKNFRKFNAVLAIIDVSRLFGAYDKYISAEDGGSHAFFLLLNNYIEIMIEEVYSSMGDVLKFSRDGLLVMWKINRDEFIANIVYNVILCAQRIQESVAALKHKNVSSKVDFVVSAGEVIFSVIGDDRARNYVLGGPPVQDLKYAKRICLPGDLVLSSSAWEHCAPSQYEYVIKDSNNVKIIKVLGSRENALKQDVSPQNEIINPVASRVVKNSSEVLSLMSEPSIYSETELIGFQEFNADDSIARTSVVEALRRRIGSHLRTYMMKPVLNHIDKEEPLEYLTEVRQITVVCVNIVPVNCSVHEYISLVDEVFNAILSIVENRRGYVSTMNLYERDILFYISFGLEDLNVEEGEQNRSENGMLSSSDIMKEMKRIGGVKTVYIGVSTGMVFCGVIGHAVRREYIVLGTPVDKAIGLMRISFDKISCDYDTVFYSSLKKDKFRSRGLNELERFGKCHVYEFIDISRKAVGFSNLEYSYPILGRFDELEYFKDILDEIGVRGRSYTGVIIEGPERSGKSRLLDAYAKIARNRQIKCLQLPLHDSYVHKSYSVLYHIFLQLFDAEDCTTIDDRKRLLLDKFSDFLAVEDFCYLNAIMRVEFPLSQIYCSDTDWKRHMKTISIFENILNKVVQRICILLDDVQNMDLLSWQFLSSAMNNDNIVVAMTLLEPRSWDNLSQVEAGVSQDKRLMNRSLIGLSPEFHAAFACQFFNVVAIPKSLENILQKRSKNSISWCETFLISVLQVHAVNFVTIPPTDVPIYDLVFPNGELLTKVPQDLSPEEMPPSLHWTHMNSLNVCVPSTRPMGFVESNRDVTGLRIDIYNRMNSYEQDFVKCAAALGTIFFRKMLKSVMNNYAPLYTSKAVAEMIRLRILECAMIQRRHIHADDRIYHVLKKRKTFSNMQHLVICDCQPSRIFAARTLPTYANCKILEFTISSYRKLFYDILPPHEKKEYHTKAVSMLERDARKCSTCGYGDFLPSPAIEEHTPPDMGSPSTLSVMAQRRGTLFTKEDKFDSRRSVLAGLAYDTEKKKDSTHIRRVSILPIHDSDNGTDGFVSVAFDAKEDYASDVGRRLRGVSMIIETVSDTTWETRLKRFRHMDYRNCRCTNTISYLFWQLHHHVSNTKDVKKLTNFMLQYSAGLIKTKQYIYASKFLSNTAESIEAIELNEQLIIDHPNAMITKSQVLLLMGDTYLAHGNYSQAKKFYTEAIAIWDIKPQTNKVICYNSMVKKLRHIMLGFPDYVLNTAVGAEAADKLLLSKCLKRLSIVQMLQNESKVSKLTILQAHRAAFESVDGFLEKGNVYLSAVQIFRNFDDLQLIEYLEKPIAMVIEEKTSWYIPEEIVIVAKVYQTMYETRILHGHLIECVEIGNKILKICNCLHLSRIKLSILPSLIEITVWLKSVNEAVDLLRELYFMSKEDVDKSAITWYYALCMDLILDAGMVIETYDTCYAFYTEIAAYKSRACVSRDPESLTRLSSCIAIWQLRKTMVIEDSVIQTVEDLTKNIKHNKFSQIYNCVKGLECYLLLLRRRINIKKSSDLYDQIKNANMIIKILKNTAVYTPFVKPFLYLLQSYMNLLRGRKSASQFYIEKSQKWSLIQGNKLMLAWIKQNKRTWKKTKYNNMAHYWLEYVTTGEAIKWQEIKGFSLDAWSTIMYPLPVPTSNI